MGSTRPSARKPLTRIQNFTAAYSRIPSGNMGQIVEWSEIITEGKDLDECRAMLQDALHEMIAAYHDLGKVLPHRHVLIESIPIET